MISIKKATFGYKEPVLQIEGLEINGRTLTALIGKNGAGKSTFLKTLSGLIPPLGGELLINAQQLFHYTEAQRSRLLAFVGSMQTVVPYLSVIDFVLLGRSPYTSVLGRYRQKDIEVVEQMLHLFNLDDLKYRELVQLSDGERQLAAFARAFTQETPVILMDEPTAFLDYGNKRSLLRVLKNATESSAKCVILSTHDIDLCIEEGISIIGIDRNADVIGSSLPLSKVEIVQRFFSH
jgi:iron complex transport system ATP-binding protein